MNTVKRKVAFLRIYPNTDPATNLPHKLDILKEIEAFGIGDYKHRCFHPDPSSSTRIVGQVDVVDAFHAQMKIGRVQLDNPPERELDDVWTEVPLKDKQGLGHRSHCVFFNNGVVGFVHMQHGPQFQQAYGLLTCRNSELKKKFTLEEIVRGDPIALAENADFGAFTFRLRTWAIAEVEKEDPSLAKTFRQLANQTEADEIEVTVKVKMAGKKTLLYDGAMRFVNLLKKVGGAFPGKQPVTKATAKILKSETKKTLMLDLLTDKFVVDVSIPTSQAKRSKCKDADVYSAIKQAYEENKVDIVAAKTRMGSVTSDKSSPE